MNGRAASVVIPLRNTVIPSQFANWRGNPPPKKEIATPACALVRNDTNGMTLVSQHAR